MIAMYNMKTVAGSLLLSCLFAACNNSGSKQDNAAAPATTDSATVTLKEETITIHTDGANLSALVVYDDAIKGKRPAVLVIPEWWGLTDYPKMRARQLARLGYVGMALDLYGDGKVAETPDSATAWSGPFYKNPEKGKIRIDSAIARVRNYEVVDPANIGAIGYCFGGGVLLNTARLGDDLKGVVSFHGSLLGTPARKDLLRTKILVCHGNTDQFVSQKDVATFKKQMDSIGASYAFIGYDNATHAFTNPASTANGQKFHMPIAYNATADTASWDAMKNFFSTLFKQ